MQSDRKCQAPVAVRAVLWALVLVTATLLPSQGAEARPLKILAFGDSLIHGYGLPAGETFPEQLQRALAADGRPVVVINGGNSGDTSASGLARLDWALADRPAAHVNIGAGEKITQFR